MGSGRWMLIVAIVSMLGGGGGARGSGDMVVVMKKKEGPLYVFGDSYVDTGNRPPDNPQLSQPWSPPYGSSWPGQPSGRFSDGFVFTDHFASYLKVKWPVPFRRLNVENQLVGDEHFEAKKEYTRRSFDDKYALKARTKGINFAFGGSGVFELPLCPNISTQIEELRTTIESGIVSMSDLTTSNALLVINGNDYVNYLSLHPDLAGIVDFISQVVEQIVLELEKLSKLGFPNIFVASIGPSGCVPAITYSNNYTSCNESVNQLITIHNNLLEANIINLQEKQTSTTFVTLDFYKAIQQILQDGLVSGDSEPLRPCCEGISGVFCGTVDENNKPLYSVCSDAKSHLYWDSYHPTHAGWKAILGKLFQSSQAQEES